AAPPDPHSSATRRSSACTARHRHPPSFPPRRSSDLTRGVVVHRVREPRRRDERRRREQGRGVREGRGRRVATGARARAGGRRARSEEHTSELQSRENLVCRLLLEKKKNKENRQIDVV